MGKGEYALSDSRKLNSYYASLMFGETATNVKQYLLNGLISHDEKFLRIMEILKRESPEIYVRKGGRDLDSILVGKYNPKPKSESQVDYWNMKVDDSSLSIKTKNVCHTAEINTIGELAQRTEEGLNRPLLRLTGFSKKVLGEVKEKLAEMEMWLGMSREEYYAQLSKSQKNV